MHRGNKRLIAAKAVQAIMMTGALVASPALAGSAGPGVVTRITGVPASTPPTILFYTNGPRTSAPACATMTDRWVIDVSTPSGQAAAAIVISAQAQGKTIYVTGTGTCSIWTDTETVNFLDVSS